MAEVCGLLCLKDKCRKKITHSFFYSLTYHFQWSHRLQNIRLKKKKVFFKLMVTLKIKYNHLPVFQSIFCFLRCKDRSKFQDKEVIWTNYDAKRSCTYCGGRILSLILKLHIFSTKLKTWFVKKRLPLFKICASITNTYLTKEPLDQINLSNVLIEQLLINILLSESSIQAWEP